MKTLPWMAVLLGAALGACSPIRAAPGAYAGCSPYHERIEGIWRDATGADRLLFVLASNSNGYGCFALMNAVPEWGVDRPISVFATVTRAGGVREWRTASHHVAVDLDTGVARYIKGERTLVGRVIKVYR